MKVKFTKRRFYNGRWYSPGDVVKMKKKFARVFIRLGVVVPAPADKEKVKPVRKKSTEEPEAVVEEQEQQEEQQEFEEGAQEDEETETPLEELPYNTLRSMCRERGLVASGTKAEMIERLSQE